MKILLLNPPSLNNKKFTREGRCTQEQGVWATLWPPLSLVVTGAVLDAAGHNVRIIDCPSESMGWDILKKHIIEFSPRLILWSTGTPSIKNDLGISTYIRETCSGVLTAVFGTHVTALDIQCMEQFPDVDYIIRNEPEITARELAGMIQDGNSASGVAGITFRNSDGKIVSNPARPFVTNLDDLPFPAWHLLNKLNYSLPLKGRNFLIVAPQRGCPFKCSFCTCQTYYGNKLRKRSPENIVAEIESNIERFDVHDFFFWSETFVVDKVYVSDLCHAILDRGLNISWTCNSRVDTVDAGLLKLMARAGCWMISFGVESGDQKVLDESEKGIRVEQAYSAVQMAKKAGIRVAGHFIFGLPGDNPEAMLKTTDLALNLGLDVAQFYSAVPFPGSRLYERAEKQGWIATDDFSMLRQDCAVMNIPGLPSDVVNRYRARAYRKFYFRPSAWWRIISMMELKGVRMLLGSAKAFLGWSG